jgi:hypothetical protein
MPVHSAYIAPIAQVSGIMTCLMKASASSSSVLT